MEMEESRYRGYTDSQLKNEYDDLESRKDLLNDNYSDNDIFEYDKYDKIEDRQLLIDNEINRRLGQQETSFIDSNDGETVDINGEEHRYEDTEWIDEDIDYTGTEGGVIRRFGTRRKHQNWWECYCPLI